MHKSFCLTNVLKGIILQDYIKWTDEAAKSIACLYSGNICLFIVVKKIIVLFSIKLYKLWRRAYYYVYVHVISI